MPVNLPAPRSLAFIVSLIVGVVSPVGVFSRPAESAEPPSDIALEVELLFWASMKDSQNPEELRAYIAAYPEGRFSSLARARLKALSRQANGESVPRIPPVSTQPQQNGVADSQLENGASSVMPTGVKPAEVFRDCEVCPQLVVIPPGRFEMGSNGHGDEEKPPREVVIPRSFGVGVYEVTVSEWDACVQDGSCARGPAPETQGRLPVPNLSWDDTQSYLKWLSSKTRQTYRLPSEAEWEYAARAGTTTRYWWGDETGVGRANCADCGSLWGGKAAAPVGSFDPNPFGLYDVHGNLWEWTQDCWNGSYQGAPGDGGPWLKGDCVSRVLRGGGWALNHDYMRLTRRNHYDWDVRYHLHGLRVVRELPAATTPGQMDDATPFETAILKAVKSAFSFTSEPTSSVPGKSLALDPVIDGLSGAESAATRAMESRVVDLIRTDLPQFQIEDLAASGSPYRYVVIGTFTGVNKERKSTGEREAFRICLTLLDREAGKVLGKARVFSQSAGIDITPTTFFRDSPAWAEDPATQAYIQSCQVTQQGDPVNPRYLDGIEAAGIINGAIKAYEKAEYEESRQLFETALKTKGGDQLRTYNGLYLASWRLGKRNQAADAFAKLVAYGLHMHRLGLKFPFEPGSTEFLIDSSSGGQAEIWLKQIAKEMLRHDDCFEIQGHSRRSESSLPSQRLSLQRAEYIKRRLAAEAPELSRRMMATGRGAEDNLIGSGTGDLRDTLDERIELRSVACPPSG